MITKNYFYIESSADKTCKLYVRAVTPVAPKGIALVLHGATLSSIIFDLKVTNYSMLEFLASQGFAAYSLDYRGYGNSTKPIVMDDPDMKGEPLINHLDAHADVMDLIKHLQKIHPGLPISLVGFSWGSNISGFTALKTDIHKLILLGPVYSYANPGWRELGNANDVMQLNKSIKSYRIVSRARWHKPWDVEIPFADKSVWRDPDLLETLCDQIELSDADWANATGNQGTIRIPTGVLSDAHRVFTLRPIYDASKITCPTLILRGEQDSASQDEDMQGLLAKLTCPKQRIDIADASHYGILEKGADRFFNAIGDFLSE
jgi:pimeloyl-ACP methyl ester carboxylesterase